MPSDLAFTVDPKTLHLDVAIKNGAPFYDESRLHKVMSRLAAVRGKWWADVSGQRGSRLGGARSILGATTTSDVEADAREALAPLVSAGEILPPTGQSTIGVNVTIDRAAGRIVLSVSWTTPTGASQSTRYALRI